MLWFIRENFVVFQDLPVLDLISVYLAAGHEDHFWFMDQTPVQLIPLVLLTQADISQIIGSWDRSLGHPWITHWWVVCTLLASGSWSYGW